MVKPERADTLIRIYPRTRKALKKLAETNRMTMAEVIEMMALRFYNK